MRCCTQLWIALIVYLLVAIARHSAKNGWTIQRVLRVLQLSFFEKTGLSEIFNPSPPPNQKDQPQMRLVS
jgi:putative transposase